MKLSIIIDAARPQQDGRCAVKLKVAHKSGQAFIPLNFSIYPSDFDGDLPKQSSYRRLALDKIADCQIKVRDIDDRLERMSATQIRDYLTSRRQLVRPSVADAIGAYALQCRAQKTADTYLYALAKFREYSGDIPLEYEDIDYKWLSAFDKWMTMNGVGTNSRSIVMRCIRAVYNDAIDNDLTDNYPFRKFKVKSVSKPKEHLTVEQFKLLRDGDFRDHNDARDFFLLSFYAVGINPIDLYSLSGLQSGRIRYQRRKTSKQYDIGVQPEFAEVLARTKGRHHLTFHADKYHNYDSFINFYRKKLYHIADDLNIPGLTYYWARYSWATLAYECGVPRDSISQALGHSFSGPAVTSVYIDYDYKRVDQANRQVLDYVR